MLINPSSIGTYEKITSAPVWDDFEFNGIDGQSDFNNPRNHELQAITAIGLESCDMFSGGGINIDQK